MIDSVLKGTGNSRFLKSAVPAGTSWADALAMLQAGTFPIDFNGINTDGFQQVGTPLNKANLLKDATAAQIGLPPSTTPDGMFQALGNTGELHVWKKTVKNAEDVPAGYTLGEVQNVTKYPITDVRSGGYTIVTKAYSNLSVDDAGNVSVDESSYVNFYNDASAVRGKFIQVYSDSDILFIPNDANISTDYKTVGSAVIHNHYTDKYQSVTGYPLTPAGTTTTYPVSTNPNAYQEGDDAKAAGYTLGEVEQNKEILRDTYGDVSFYVNYSNSLSVSDDGTVTLKDPAGSGNYAIGGTKEEFSSYCNSNLRGKFCKFYIASGNHGTIVDGIYFIPADAMFSHGSASAPYTIISSKVQPVTGYAAIPAGTTIEYLGKLGDKARVQVLSYVGTGTYGSDHPCSLTFDFVPKVAMMLYRSNGSNINNSAIYARFFPLTTLTTSYKDVFFAQPNTNGNNGRMKISEDRKTVSWFNTYGAYYQENESGITYVVAAIG